MPSPFAEVLGALRSAMDELDLGWYVMGAQAAMVHGSSRVTSDVDATVRLGECSIHDLVAGLARHALRPRVDDPAFLEQTRVLPLTHEPTGIPVDLIFAGPGLEEAFLGRAKVRQIEGVPVPIACAEDLVVMKLLAGRPKDLEDVVAILAAQAEGIDLASLRELLGELELALDQSDLIPALDDALERAMRHR